MVAPLLNGAFLAVGPDVCIVARLSASDTGTGAGRGQANRYNGEAVAPLAGVWLLLG